MVKMASMKGKKETKGKVDKIISGEKVMVGEIQSAADLKAFLVGVRDKMTDEAAAPIYVVSLMNHLLTNANIYRHLNDENKEIARDLWLRLKQAGLQLRNPPMLFGNADEDALATSA